MIDRYAVMGPTPCHECRRPVIWERVAGRWFLGELTTDTIRRHHCRPRCHVVMRSGLVCERTADHANRHSTRATLDRVADYMRRRYAASAA